LTKFSEAISQVRLESAKKFYLVWCFLKLTWSVLMVYFDTYWLHADYDVHDRNEPV
jgi:hypothetical protein